MSEIVLADHRDRVTNHLSAGFAGGAFEVEELERRLALVQTASTPAELDALVTDLAAAPAQTALVPAQRVRVVMGSIEKRGPWAMPQHMTARVVCGHLELDLREATLSPGVTTLEVRVTMGNVEVIVPPNVTVEVEASSFLGHVEQRTERAPAGGPIVRVVGKVKLGNLELSTLRRGETRRDAHRRRRADRKWRRHMRHHRALPPPPWEW